MCQHPDFLNMCPIYIQNKGKKTNIVQTFLSGLFEFLNTFATENSVFLPLSQHRDNTHTEMSQ